ncbi:MAG: hypothetical protein ACK5HL_02515 [Bacilli bacterium]
MKNKIKKIIKYTSLIFSVAILVCGINYIIPKFFEKTETNTTIVKNIDESIEVDAATLNPCWYMNGSVIIGFNPACESESGTKPLVPKVVNGIKVTHVDLPRTGDFSYSIDRSPSTSLVKLTQKCVKTPGIYTYTCSPVDHTYYVYSYTWAYAVNTSFPFKGTVYSMDSTWDHVSRETFWK